MTKHPSPQNIALATDAAIFTVRDGALQVLLIQMKKKPFTGQWALPGGLLGDEELTRSAATRILKEQTGIASAYLEQLMTFDHPSRDPFGRVVSVAWFALIPDSGKPLKTTEKYADVRWWPAAKTPKLAYDHGEILATAIKRLRAKMEYSTVVRSLLPDEFTLSDLQTAYESILARVLDKRNFRKKLLSLGLLAVTKKKRGDGAHRPAALYRFKKEGIALVEML